MNKKISIFIPVYNEEKILFKNVARVLKYCTSKKYDFEIIIIDDASKDNSFNIAKWLCSKYKNLRYIHYDNGPSKRENLARSFKRGKGTIIVFIDGDLSADLRHLDQLINYIENGSDIAIGSRYLHNSSIKRAFFRHFLSLVYNLFLKIYFNSKVHDHQCGLKAFKRKVVLNLIDKIGYCEPFKRGWFWDAELIILAQRIGYKIVEVPVEWKERQKGTFNVFKELRMIPYIICAKKRL